jgi:histidine triad (HIT) family protein
MVWIPAFAGMTDWVYDLYKNRINQKQEATMSTIFTKIISREIPAKIVYEDELCLAFHDVNPQAPIHVLLIPKKEIPRLVDAQAEDQALLGHLMITANKVATQLGVGDAFRLAVNNGADAGQSVFHLHLHILAGRAFKWPPG